MRKAINLLAFIVECVVAYKAYPSAVLSFGELTGFVLVSSTAVGIYFSWYVFFNTKKSLHRFSVAITALVLTATAIMSVYISINIDGEIEREKSITSSNEELLSEYKKSLAEYRNEVNSINAQYKQQEETRIKSLERINLEIKATKKLDQPDIYKDLLAAQSLLLVKTKKEAYPVKPIRPVKNEYKREYRLYDVQLFQSSIISILVPILLFISKMMESVSHPVRSQKHSKYVRSLFAKKQTNNIEQKANLEGEMLSFKNMEIPVNNDNQVTLTSIANFFGCSDRKSRKFRADAKKEGLLILRNNRYYYPNEVKA